MKKTSIFGVILAGGASSRLFPFNKILSDLSGSGKTLIQQAFSRAATLAPRNQIHLLAAKEMVGPLARQLRVSKHRFFVDPVRRGTWPALMWAMAHLRRKNPDAVLAVLTGDHIIPRLAAFRRAAVDACRLAVTDPSIVMLGVEPGDAAALWTGYGVFRVEGRDVGEFAEKPSLAQAETMIQAGGWRWNSGMFFFRISTAEQALARFQPPMHAQYERLCVAVAARRTREAKRLYGEFPAKIAHPLDPARQVDNTIDFAIMTPLVKAPGALKPFAVCGGLPVWTDLGHWEALTEVIRSDRRGNTVLGNVICDAATRNCVLAADRGFQLDIKGLENAVVAVSKRGAIALSRLDLPAIKDHVASVPEKSFKIVSTLPGVHVKRSGRKVVVSGTPFIR